MKFLSSLLTLILFTTATCSHAELPSSSLPLSIDSVETHRVDDSLIRTIRHNMEIEPLIEIERISVPYVELAEVLRIQNVRVDGKTLPFEHVAGVYVDSMSLDIESKKVVFTLDYYYLKGGTRLIDCQVPVGNNQIGEVSCHFKK